MKNAGRLVAIDIADRKAMVVEGLDRNYPDLLHTHLASMSNAIEAGNNVDVIAEDVILKSVFLVDVEQYQISGQFSSQSIMDAVPLAATALKAKTNVETNYEKHLDNRISEVRDAVADRDAPKLRMLNALLPVAFGIRINEVLESVEQSIANALLLNS